MGIKSQVLSSLESSRGQYLSGAQLAEELHVTRSAVWKAIQTLQKDGHRITAVTNRGYCLSETDAVLSKEGIEQALCGAAAQLRIEVYPEVTSTNTLLKRHAEEGEPEGKVLVADRQTMGKGRSGRSFYSPSDTGVYFSLLLRPRFSQQESLLITTAAAVAAARAIEEVASLNRVGIKWVNDLIYQGKKICGILTEASVDFETGGMSYAVLGIGVNVTDPQGGFPDDIRDIAGSLFGRGGCGGAVRNRLVAETLNNFMEYYETLTDRAFMDDYRARSVVIGQTVEAYDAAGSRTVRILDIDDDAALIAQAEDGTRLRLTTGEVRIRL